MTNKNKFVTALTLLVAVMVCVSVSFAQPQITPSRPAINNLNNDLRTVTSLIRVGEFERAISFLDHLQMTYGDDPRIRDTYKQVYREAKMYPELEKMIRDGLARDRTNPMLLSELAEARYLQRDQSGADSLWNLALGTGKPSEFLYRFIAELKLRYGLYDDAVNIFLKGRRSLANPVLFSMDLANIYEIQHDYPKAVDEYILELQHIPDQIGIVSTRIRGLMEDDDNREEIINAVKKNIEQSPASTDLYEILGDLYIKQNQMDKALECYKSIGNKQNDDGQSLVRFASRCYDSKAYSTAIGAVDEYFRTSKKASLRDIALLTKAESQSATGLIDEALVNFQMLSANSADYRIRDEATLSSGLIYAGAKSNCDSALIVWNAMLKTARVPDLANRARVEMALCYLKTNSDALAETLLAQVAGEKMLDDNSERAAFLLGDMAIHSGDLKKADDIFKSMVWQYPQGAYSNDALMRLDVISLLGDDEASQKYLVRFGEAMRALALGIPLNAATILSDSLFANSPIAEQTAYYSAASFAKAGQNRNAIDIFKKYVERFPDGLYVDRAYLELGDLYIQDPVTYPDAKSAYNKILEAFPESPTTELARDRLRQLESQRKIG